MANTFDSNLQTLLNGINGLTEAERFNMNEMIITESNKVLNIIETHPNFMNVRSGAKIPILDATDDYAGFTTINGGGCKLPSCDISQNYSVYTWELGMIGCKVEICLEQLSNDFKTFWDLWQTYSEDDISSAFAQFLLETFQRKLINAIFRVAYFGDKESPNESINAIDGYIKQMQTRVTANPNQLVVIDENAGTTVQAQMLNDGEKIYEYFLQMYERFTELPGHDLSNAVWRLDRQLVSAWVGFLNRAADKSQYNCNCISADNIAGGRMFTVDNLAIFGLPVEVYDFNKAMQAAGTPWYTAATGLYAEKNIMILTNRSTMQLGFEIEETKNKTTLKYDDINDFLVYKGRALFGAGLPTDIFVVGMGATTPAED